VPISPNTMPSAAMVSERRDERAEIARFKGVKRIA
jgi:hypothetical protein